MAIISSTAFGVISGAVGIFGTAWTIIDSLINHSLSGDFGEGGLGGSEPTNQEILDRLDEISGDIDTLQVELTQVINAQFEGLRQQALASALSRAESARDLLSSVDASDTVSHSEIIADASRALRDVLAQAREISNPRADYTPTIDDVLTAFAAVSLSAGVRMEVASRLESDELGSDRINRQLRDVADYVDSVGAYVRNALELTYTIDDADTVTFTLEGIEFEETRYGPVSGEPYTVVEDISATVTFDRSPTGVLREAFVFGVWIGVTQTGGADSSITGFSDSDLRALEGEMENRTLERLAFGEHGERLAGIADDFRALADGVERVLAAVPGADASGALTGSEGNDLLIGAEGNDTIDGLGDGDILKGRDGDDDLNGGSGSDQLTGGPGDDDLDGGADDDQLLGGPGDDVIDGGAGFDRAGYLGTRDQYTVTTDGTDFLIVDGPDGRDHLVNVEELVFKDTTLSVLQGGDVAETLEGEAGGSSVVWGRGGGDRLWSSGADNVLLGSSDSDFFGVRAGDAIMRSGNPDAPAGEGDEAWLIGTDAESMLDMPDPDAIEIVTDAGRYELDLGFDRVAIVTETTIALPFGGTLPLFVEDQVLSIQRDTNADETIEGGSGRDILIAKAGADTLIGGAGDDFLMALGNDDVIDGGAGQDTVRLFGSIHDYDFAADDATEELLVREKDSGTASFTRIANVGADMVEFIQFDEVRARVVFNNDEDSGFFGGADSWIVAGRGGSDDFTAGDRAQVFFGGTGDDILTGGPEADTIAGGEDDDVLTGGGERDTFVFEVQRDGNGAHGIDEITDFQPGVDRILLKGDAFARVANGVEARDLAINFPPDEAEDVLFTLGDTLFVDPDGNGDEAPIAFARLDNAFALRASDFVVDATSTWTSPSEPDPVPEEIIILGEETGFELLNGTDADETIISRGGLIDTITGNGGADRFVFGAEASNGIRERDVITDYEVGIDEIALQSGAVVQQINAFAGVVSLVLSGDGDTIAVRGDGVNAVNLTFTEYDEFTIA